MPTRSATKRDKPKQPKTMAGRVKRMVNPNPNQSKMQKVTDATRASDIKALKNFAKGAGAVGLVVTAYDYIKGKYDQYQNEKNAEKKREIMREIRGKVVSETKLAKGGSVKKKVPANKFKPCSGCTSPKTCAKLGCKKKRGK